MSGSSEVKQLPVNIFDSALREKAFCMGEHTGQIGTASQVVFSRELLDRSDDRSLGILELLISAVELLKSLLKV